MFPFLFGNRNPGEKKVITMLITHSESIRQSAGEPVYEYFENKCKTMTNSTRLVNGTPKNVLVGKSKYDFFWPK